MTNPAVNQARSSSEAPGVLAPQAGRSADIMELVMADHRRIRRLREALQDAARCAGDSGPDWMPAHVWQRLSGLLMAHFDAEEEICYLPMSTACPDPAAGWRDAIADYDDIREAIGEASLQRACSPQWWRAVSAALTASAEHLDREEAGILAGCLPRLTSSRRHTPGRQWLAFTAAWARDSGDQGFWNAPLAARPPSRLRDGLVPGASLGE